MLKRRDIVAGNIAQLVLTTDTGSRQVVQWPVTEPVRWTLEYSLEGRFSSSQGMDLVGALIQEAQSKGKLWTFTSIPNKKRLPGERPRPK